MASAQVLPPGQALGILGDPGQYGGIANVGRGPNINLIVNSQRFMELDRKESYFACTQHNHKTFDFDGRMVAHGSISNPLLSTEQISHFVPLRQRRPSAPYRIAKKIVRAFTNLLFSERRAPTIGVEGDKISQDFIQCIVDEGDLMGKMIRARDLGGATGSVGLSWCFHQGSPRFNVHNSKHIFVNKWADRDELIPEHVIEMYRFSRDEWNPQARKVEKMWYWFRRDWLPDFDLVYQEIPVSGQQSNEPDWIVDEQKSVAHGDGISHFEWIQNLPTDDVDGEADYDGLYDNFDTIDLLNSVIARGGVLNLDPTLVLNVDAEMVARRGIRKGSDNALILDPQEKASYLEVAGASITAGLTLFDSLRKQVLEIAECILPDPDTLAAQGTSSVALKVIYSAMTAKCDILRKQYGRGMTRMLNNMYQVSKKRWKQRVIVLDDQGEPMEGEEVLMLPPRIEKIPKLNDLGELTGEEESIPVEREPGNGGKITMVWGPYFKPTPADQQTIITTAQSAVQKPVISHRSAVAQAAQAFDLNPDDEYKLVKLDQAEAESKMAGMFPGDAAGTVSDKDELPDGAEQLPPTELPDNVVDDDEPSLIKEPPGPPGALDGQERLR